MQTKRLTASLHFTANRPHIAETGSRGFIWFCVCSSIVGYQTTPISGYQMKTPTFKNVTSVNYPIDNFTVQGATDAMTSIQVLDEEGQVIGDYYWYNAFGELPAGWFDALGNDPAGIELKPGEAVFFYTEEDGVTIRSAGEVPGEISYDIAGYVMAGNGSPVNLPIDNLIIEGATDAMTSIQVLDAEGQVVGDYYWYNAFGDLPAGWFDALGNEPADITLAPGQGVLFYSEESGVKATVPAAL